MEIKIFKSSLEGRAYIPPSRSITHRAIIAASLARGKSAIYNISYLNDISATMGAMENFGVKFQKDEDFIQIDSSDFKICEPYFNCVESGPTLRFTLPIALSMGGEFIFDGLESLKIQPADFFYSIFQKNEIYYKELGNYHLPVLIKGELKDNIYHLDGDVSSQFISGMLFALSNMNSDKESVLVIDTKLEMKSYVDLTIDVLKDFGVEVVNLDYQKLTIVKKAYKPCEYTIEADFSHVAFFALGGIIGNKVTVDNLNKNSKQGDRAIIDIVKSFGATVEEIDDGYIFYKSATKGINIDVSEVPDLVTVILSLGVVSEGETIITGLNRLRTKENDRVLSMVTELKKMGASIVDMGNYVKIQGTTSLKGGVEVETYKDHRVAMALGVLATICEEEVTIKNAECVEKTFKTFFHTLRKLNCQLSTTI